MKYFKEIGLVLGVILLLNFRGVIWFYLKEMVRRFISGYDVQALLAAKDVAGLQAALRFRRQEFDSSVNYSRSNAAIALGQVGNLASLDRLLLALTDKDSRVIQTAAQAIAQIVYRHIRQPLLTLSAPDQQQHCQLLLRKMVNLQAKCVPPLITAFRAYREPLVLAALGMIAGGPAATMLIEVVSGSLDVKLRVVALQSLLNTNDPRVGMLLLTSLQDKQPELRRMAAELLGNARVKTAEPALAKLLADNNAEVQKAAILALGKFGNPQRAEALIPLLQDPKNKNHLALIDTLGDLKDPRAIGPLLSWLGNSDPTIRRKAALSLAVLGETKWAELIKGDSEDYFRLGQAPAEVAIPILTEAVTNAKPEVRLACIRGLALLQDPQARAALQARLKDTVAQNRLAAIVALAASQTPSEAEAIRPFLMDPQPEVRAAAVQGLAGLGEPQWQEWIKGDEHDVARLGESRDPRVFGLLMSALDQAEAVIALGKNQNSKAVPPLLNIIKKTDHPHRILAIHSLGELADKKATLGLAELVKEKDTPLRLEVIEALARIGDVRSVEPLLVMLKEPDSKLAIAAARALAGLKAPNINQSLQELLSNSLSSVRLAAVQALAELGESDWQEWFKGEPADFSRLATSGRKQAYELLMQAMLSPNAERVIILEALGQLGDKRAISYLQEKLVDNNNHYRNAAGRALEKLGEPQWSKCLKGNDVDDLFAMASLGLQFATRKLIEELKSSYRHRREQVAKALIKLASRPDQELKHAWSEVFRLITKPHSDSHNDTNRSSDCTHSDHTDFGVGLSFPEKYAK